MCVGGGQFAPGCYPSAVQLWGCSQACVLPPEKLHWRRGPALLCLRGLCSARAPPSALPTIKSHSSAFPSGIENQNCGLGQAVTPQCPVPESLLPAASVPSTLHSFLGGQAALNAGSWLGSDLDLRLGFSTDLLFDSEQDNLWISYLSILSSTFLNGGGRTP